MQIYQCKLSDHCRHRRERRSALNLPNEATSAFRLINSEGDGLSGLTVWRTARTSCVV